MSNRSLAAMCVRRIASVAQSRLAIRKMNSHFRLSSQLLEDRRVLAGDTEVVRIVDSTTSQSTSAANGASATDIVGAVLGELDRRYGKDILTIGGGSSRIDIGEQALNIAGSAIGMPYLGTVVGVLIGLLDKPDKHETPQHQLFSQQSLDTELFVRSVFSSIIEKIPEASLRAALNGQVLGRLDVGIEASRNANPDGDHLYNAQRALTDALMDSPNYLPPTYALPHPSYKVDHLWDVDRGEFRVHMAFYPVYAAAVQAYAKLASQNVVPSQEELFHESFGREMTDDPGDHVRLYGLLQPILAAKFQIVDDAPSSSPRTALTYVSRIAHAAQANVEFNKAVLEYSQSLSAMADRATAEAIGTLSKWSIGLGVVAAADDFVTAKNLMTKGFNQLSPVEQAEVWRNLNQQGQIGQVSIDGRGAPFGLGLLGIGAARIAAQLTVPERLELVGALGRILSAAPIPVAIFAGSSISVATDIARQYLGGDEKLAILDGTVSLLGEAASQIGKRLPAALIAEALIRKMESIVSVIGMQVSPKPPVVMPPPDIDYQQSVNVARKLTAISATAREANVANSPDGSAIIIGGSSNGPQVGGGAAGWDLEIASHLAATRLKLVLDMRGERGPWGWGAHSITREPIFIEINGRVVAQLDFSVSRGEYGDFWAADPSQRQIALDLLLSEPLRGPATLTVRAGSGSVIDLVAIDVTMTVHSVRLVGELASPPQITTLAAIESPPNGPSIIDWQPHREAERYQVVVTGRDSDNVVLTNTTVDTRYELPDLEAGEYWFRVRSVNASGFSRWSDAVLVQAPMHSQTIVERKRDSAASTTQNQNVDENIIIAVVEDSNLHSLPINTSAQITYDFSDSHSSWSDEFGFQSLDAEGNEPN